jgi:hypothetical protein
MSIHTVQAVAWIKRLRHTLCASQVSLVMLSEQYFLLDLMVQAVDGIVVFTGAPDPDEHCI